MSSLREQLLAVAAAAGRLSPSAVVAAATSVDHPLHNHFEWDDAIAGHAYRLVQARQLIARVVHVSEDGEPSDMREFHAVRLDPQTREHTWMSLDAVRGDPVALAVLLRQMERAWQALFARYGHMQEFSAMVQRDMEEKRRRDDEGTAA